MFVMLMIRVKCGEKDKTRKKCGYRVWNFRLDGSEYLGKDIPNRGNYKSKYLKMETH